MQRRRIPMIKSRPKYRPVRSFAVEDDGFFGEYYVPERISFPGKAMVVCSGSDGSFLLTQLTAERFCKAGMPVIALAYWNAPGTPGDLELIPVEYMLSACRWLQGRGLHAGVWGISMGGLYALLCGSLFPEIECVIAASPVHALFQAGSFTGGLHLAHQSPFSFRGQPLPYVKAEDEKAVLKRIRRNLLLRREPDTLFYYDMLKLPHDKNADVKVENIHGPVFLISGGEDVMVPADWMCRAIMTRLEKNHFRYPHIHHDYAILSHCTCPHRPASCLLFKTERHHISRCRTAREQCWNDLLTFLHKYPWGQAPTQLREYSCNL